MIRTILGRRRHGKTTLLIKLLKERCRPAIVVSFDKYMREQFPPDRRFLSTRALLDHIIEAGGVDINKPLLVSIFDPAEFTTVCKIVIAHQNLLLMIDEADMFDSANSQDPEFRKIIHYGAHEFGGQTDFVVVARRPQDLSRDVRSQTDEFYLFRMTDNLELDYVEKNLGSGLREYIRTLPKFSYVRYDGESVELCRLPAP